MIRPLWILGIIFLALGGLGAMLPQKTNRSVDKNAKELLRDVLVQAYVLDTDELADRLIKGDPSLQLIDVRSAEEYKAYSLPGAINIPLDSLLNASWGGYLDQDVKQNVFYSNGSTLAVQAWMLVHQRGYPNNFYLKGGLNEWFATIIQPPRPAESAPEEAFRQYRTRLAANQFFTGKSGIPAPDAAAPKILKPKVRKKKTRVQGGCS
jgi:rhodanese-related sulfurtransferase